MQVLINYLKEQSNIGRAGGQQKICNSPGSNEGVTETLALQLSDDKHKMKMSPLTSTSRAQQIEVVFLEPKTTAATASGKTHPGTWQCRG